MERIAILNAETSAALQTTFFNKVVEDAKMLGLDLKFGNINQEGFHFKTTLEGSINSDEALAAKHKSDVQHLKLHDLKIGQQTIVWNRLCEVIGYDDTKYRRTVMLKDSQGRTFTHTPEVIHEGIAQLQQTAANKRKPKDKTKTEPKAAASKRQPRQPRQTKTVEQKPAPSPDADAGGAQVAA